MADNAVDIDLHHLIPFGRPTSLPKKVIIVHTTENALGTPAKNIIDYQVRTRSGSYHRLVDSTGKITLANTDDWQVWATGNKGNDMALHVSIVWQAKTTRAEWLAQPQILDGVARVIAHWSKKYGIPLVKLSRAELGAGKHGVAGHLEAQVWGNTDHWDPGYHFPYDVVLEKARQINNPTPHAPSSSSSKENPVHLIRSLVNTAKSFTQDTMLALIDRATWEIRVIVNELARKQGIDPDKIVADAIRKDNEK